MSNKNTAKTSEWPQTLRVTAQPHNASRMRAFVRKHADTAGFSEDAVAEIEVAVGEAVTNAILYGQPNGVAEEEVVRIEVGVNGALFYIEVQDPGPGFDPNAVQEVGPDNGDAVGGRGLYLMRALMDNVEMRRHKQGMQVRLERSLPRTP